MFSLSVSALYRSLVRFWWVWLALILASLLLSASGIMAQSAPVLTEIEPVDCVVSSADPGCVGTPSFTKRRLFGTGRDITNIVRTGDVNGDGYLDIVQANNGQSAVYLNDGSGKFLWEGSKRRFGGDKDNTLSIAVGDVNNDGMLDLVAGRDDGRGVIFFNNNGAFQTGVLDCKRPDVICLETGSEAIEDVALGDLNGKNGLDIILAGAHGAKIYFNNGHSEFPTPDAKEIGDVTGGVNRIALADLDDGEGLDVVLVGAGFGRVFSNDGLGNFLTEHVQKIEFSATSPSGLVIADIDGQNGLDIVVSSKDDLGSAIYLNDGAGKFDGARSRLATGIRATNVAAGDVDGNGYVDLAWVDSHNAGALWLFGKGTDHAHPSAIYFDARQQSVTSVALADLNNDGSLDLVVGKKNLVGITPVGTQLSPDSVFFNDQRSNHGVSTRMQLPGNLDTAKRELRLGDIDGNGSLDAVVSLVDSGAVVLQNDGRGNLSVTAELPGRIWNVALADLDNRNGLDIVAIDLSSGSVIVRKQSESGQFFAPENVKKIQVEGVQSIALGDMNGDGHVDIVVGNFRTPHIVLINDGNGDFDDRHTFGVPQELILTVSVHLGDFDADGDLDVLTINLNSPPTVYFNDGLANFRNDNFSLLGSLPKTAQVGAVGDFNGDGYLDVILPGLLNRALVFLNDGHGYFPDDLSYEFGPFDTAPYGADSGDLNSDGHPDIAIFAGGELVTVFQNDGSGGFSTDTARTYELPNNRSGDAPSSGSYGDVKFGDMDGDGQLDLVAAAYDQVWVYLNHQLKSDHLTNTPPLLHINHPVRLANAPGYASPQILDSPVITITYSLFDNENDSVRMVRACYSLDGGGKWHPAVEPENSSFVSADIIRPDNGCPYVLSNESRQTAPLAASISGVAHTFRWDTLASGLFGQSDNVIFRLEAYPSQSAQHNGSPGPFQHPFVSTQTYPFRVRGNQVRVISDAATTDYTADAIVYRLPAGKERGAEPLGGIYHPFRTTATGFLQGRAEMTIDPDPERSDRLVALWPSAEVTQSMPTRDYISQETFPITLEAQSSVRSQLVISDARRIGDIGLWVAITPAVPVTMELKLIAPRHDPTEISVEKFLPASQHLVVFEDTDQDAPQRCDGDAVCRVYVSDLANLHGTLADGTWTLEIANPTDKPLRLEEWGLALQLSPLNFTSAKPITTGLQTDPVTGGVQTLTVTAENPLLLFDLDVALEWDARNDENYQAQLSADLRRASELLYDWTNGQVALGNVRVYHDARRNTLPDGSSAWNNAHIRIYASNRLRPNADQGGIISQAFSETITLTRTVPVTTSRVITYLPGQVRMGATWNRYGDATAGNLGDDWPAALAHELGHYLLFLDDNYLGLQDNLIVPLRDDECPGAMNNPYSNNYSEFHPAQGWAETTLPSAEQCGRTLSDQNTERSDWDTITEFYPWLIAPTEPFTGVLIGPSLLPLAVTQVSYYGSDPRTSDPLIYSFEETIKEIKGLVASGQFPAKSSWLPETSDLNLSRPLSMTVVPESSTSRFNRSIDRSGAITSTAPLEVPIFYLKPLGAGDPFRASSQARAFLFQDTPYAAVIDLGQASGDQVFARGARPLDRLCVYDSQQNFVGCKSIRAGDDQVELNSDPDWKPEIIVSPEVSGTTHTLHISLSLPNAAANKGLDLGAQLYPMDRPALDVQRLQQAPLSETDDQITYSAVITTTDDLMQEPVLEGYLWIGSKDRTDQHQTITEFAIGGNPVRIRAMRAPGDRRGVRIRAMRVRIRAMRAPAASTDGQVLVYPGETLSNLNEEWSFILQPATRLPKELSWATPVGRAYWLAASSNITDTSLAGSSITFEYLRSDVPAGEEAFIRMYVWDQGKQQWRMLDEQESHPEHNLISARLEGEGLYALFAHYEIPLQSGWNLIGYPVQTSGVLTATRPVSNVLQSIAGKYSVVYGYDPCDADDPWKVYSPGVDGLIDDLDALDFGHGYWINVTSGQTETLYLRGAFAADNAPGQGTSRSTCVGSQFGAAIPAPPTTYYGQVKAGTGFSPVAGLPVSATIDGVVCGIGVTRSHDDMIVYFVTVKAAGPGNGFACGSAGKEIKFHVDGQESTSASWIENGLQRLDLSLAADLSGETAPASACTKLLPNGDFENGLPWNVSSTDDVTLAGGQGHGVSQGLRMSTASGSTVFIQQELTLPADATQLDVRFVFKRAEGSVYGPDLRLSVNGQTVWTQETGSSQWRTADVDLSGYRGKHVILRLKAVGWQSHDTIAAVIDDLNVLSCH